MYFSYANSEKYCDDEFFYASKKQSAQNEIELLNRVKVIKSTNKNQIQTITMFGSLILML